jgi:hypothetical protein
MDITIYDFTINIILQAITLKRGCDIKITIQPIYDIPTFGTRASPRNPTIV